MRLADLRKLAIRRRINIGFTTREGTECVITGRGVARIPRLKRSPEFNIEEELAHAREFRVETPGAGSRAVSRAEIEAMAGAEPAAVSRPDQE